ncbi:MAG: FecR family protein [Myxococcota bacterium]
MTEPAQNDALAERMADLREHVPTSAPEWDAAREHAIWSSVRRPRPRMALTAAAALLIGAAAFAFGRMSAPSAPEARPAPHDVAPAPSERAPDPATPIAPAPSPVVRFADGSTATRLDGVSELQVLEAGGEGTRLGLVRGGARFDVVPQHRPFRVEAGAVAVEVLGTAFAVRHAGEGRVAVSVDHGRVRVAWDGGAAELGAGERGVFPPPPSAELPTPAPDEEASVEVERPARATRSQRATRRVAPPSPEADWRSLADEGRMQAAYEVLEQQRFQVRDQVAELMEASDVARLSGHPRQALPPLRQVLSRHRSDPRAASAAFTLGRLYLETLSEPARAADAFAEARRLRPRGPLAVDAFAREIEARGRSGERAEARTLAERFLAAHPNHPREGSVRRWIRPATEEGADR